jgi:hypothetical protein
MHDKRFRTDSFQGVYLRIDIGFMSGDCRISMQCDWQGLEEVDGLSMARFRHVFEHSLPLVFTVVAEGNETDFWWGHGVMWDWVVGFGYGSMRGDYHFPISKQGLLV